MNTFMSIAKLILIALYVAAAISPFVPALADKSNILIGLSLLLLVIHLVEYAVLKDKLKAAAPGKNHFLQTFLFGVAHTKPVFAGSKP